MKAPALALSQSSNDASSGNFSSGEGKPTPPPDSSQLSLPFPHPISKREPAASGRFTKVRPLPTQSSNLPKCPRLAWSRLGEESPRAPVMAELGQNRLWPNRVWPKPSLAKLWRLCVWCVLCVLCVLGVVQFFVCVIQIFMDFGGCHPDFFIVCVIMIFMDFRGCHSDFRGCDSDFRGSDPDFRVCCLVAWLLVVCWCVGCVLVCVGCVLGVCWVCVFVVCWVCGGCVPGVCWVFCCVFPVFCCVLLLLMFPFFLSTCLALVGVHPWRAPKIDFPQQEKAQNETKLGPLLFPFLVLPAPPSAPPDRPSAGPPLPQTASPQDNSSPEQPPQDHASRTAPPLGPPLRRTAQNFALLGLHTTTRELQTCTFQGPGLQKNHQNSTRRPPEREERVKFPTGEEKKGRNFGPPTLRRTHSRPPPFGPPLLVKDCCGILRRTLQHPPAQQTNNKSEKKTEQLISKNPKQLTPKKQNLHTQLKP